ncbi:MAG: acyl carrier protein [Acidiferrobacterales bacterium]
MPGYDETLAQLYEILKPYAKEGLVLSEETELVADLGLDSMQVMQLLLETEERFDISIPLNVLPDVRTVRDFALQIQQQTGQR